MTSPVSAHPPNNLTPPPGHPNTPTVDLVELLGAVAVVANSDDEPTTALQNAISQIGGITGWPVGHTYITDASGALHATDSWWQHGHLTLDALEQASRTESQAGIIGLPGRVLTAGAPVWIADLDKDHRFPRAAAARAVGLRAAFAFPVRASRKIVAVLEFFSREPLAPEPAFMATIDAVGNQLGRVFERFHAHEQLLQAAERSERVLNGAGDAFIATDDQGLITGWNDQAEQTFGFSRVEAIGHQVSELIIPEPYREAHDAGMRHFVKTEQPRVMGERIELEGLRKSGEVFPLEMSFWALKTAGTWAFHAFGRDITTRKAREADLAYRALHDSLTGLANRALILDRLDQALARHKRSRRGVAVMFCDLDRFKLVNDSLGHEAGDRLLKAVAARLLDVVRASDTVGRIAGDEFVVVCEDLETPAEANLVAERLLAALDQPLMLDDDRVRPRASIGIALAPHTGSNPEALIRDASAAMSRAKQRGRGQAKVFDKRMRKLMRDRLRTETDLVAGLDRGELRLHYQPIVSLDGGHIVGFEALVRWQHPKRGLLAPAEFIALAEETGLIVPLGNWVIDDACRQAKAWQQQGCSDLSVAVNLSERQVSRDDFVTSTAAALMRAELDPACVRVEFELTESLLMSDPEHAQATLAELRRLGIRLSIDDFGTGYSSLGYLKNFPVDVIKIDRSFVTNLDNDARDLSLVTAITELGHALGLRVLAEGVERAQQRERLLAIGCDLAQGFFFAKPAPASEIAPMLGLGPGTQAPPVGVTAR